MGGSGGDVVRSILAGWDFVLVILTGRDVC